MMVHKVNGESSPTAERVTVAHLLARKQSGPKIVRVNCYDYLTAVIVDEVGVDMILVGESVGRYVLGYADVSMVTFDDILHHAQAVRRGARRAMVVADLPLDIHRLPLPVIIRMGQRLRDCSIDAVKVEGGDELLPAIEGLVAADIPVHGTLRYDASHPDAVQQSRQLYRQALAQEQTGCFMLSLAGFPASLAGFVTQELAIPTIGSGSGPLCNGQVMVINDLLGLFDGPARPFVKVYANLRQQMTTAVTSFANEVITGRFPDADHYYDLDDIQLQQLMHLLAKD